MGDRTTQERHLLHAGQVDIADEPALPTDVAIVLLTQQPCPDAFRGHARPLCARHPSRPVLFGASADVDDLNSQITLASVGRGAWVGDQTRARRPPCALNTYKAPPST